MQVARLTALVVGGFALVAAVAGAGLGAPSPAAARQPRLPCPA